MEEECRFVDTLKRYIVQKITILHWKMYVKDVITGGMCLLFTVFLKHPHFINNVLKNRQMATRQFRA